MTGGTDRPRLLADNFEKCDQCGEIVLIHGRGDCLELDDAIYCPRHARPHMSNEDWQLRWGEAMRLLGAVRDDPSKAVKYGLIGCPGSFWVVHDKEQIYQVWRRCEDDEQNYTTYSESSLVRNIERRSSFGAYVGDPPHLVSVADAPINADLPEGFDSDQPKLLTDGGVCESDTERSGRKLSAFPYIGSKTYLAPWIVDHFRDHETFVVPFGGAAGVLLNKPRSRAEIFNDRDEFVVEFFEVVRDEPDALADAVRNIPYSRGLYNRWSQQFRDARSVLAEDRVERAARWMFLRYASFSGRYGQRAGFATDTPRKGPQKSEIWARVPKRVQKLRDRFKGVAIESGDYSTIFERYDEPDVLFYCDPPYVEEKDNYYRGPLFDHASLVEDLEDLEGHWAVSYSEPPAGLEDIATAVVGRDYSRSAALDNSSRPERLYLSYDPADSRKFVNASTAQTTLVQTDGGRNGRSVDTATDHSEVEGQ